MPVCDTIALFFITTKIILSMKKILKQKVWLVAFVIVLIVYLASVITPGQATKTRIAVDSCNCSADVNIPFGSNVPGDLPPGQFNSQTNSNCFGWWQFVSLNWPSEGDYFGTPGSTAPVQWETYITADELYPPNGVRPPAWEQVGRKLPADVLKKDKRMSEATLFLTATSKFRDHPMIVLDSSNEEEAHPEFGPAWLGAQNGTNLWYTIHMNRDEYNFIVNNGYYNANTQCDSAAAGVPVVFPEGQYNGPTGAVEIKSAWMEVTDPDNKKWLTYKLSKAVVLDASTGEYRFTLVALVGLHILQKTASQPQWVWTTFEHENNVPDGDNPSTSYNLYNANCQPKILNIPAGCSNTGGPDTIGCEPNKAPGYYLCKGAGPVPIQVTRRFPIPDTSRLITNTLHNFIRQKYPESIWLHYKLINVLWSQAPPPPPPTQPVNAPVKTTGMQPLEPVANTTMETYIQRQTCTGCHRYASISTAGSCDSALKAFSSDFSFTFGLAQVPGSSPKAQKKKK